MTKTVFAGVLALFMHLPLALWLQPPFFASWALGVAAYCLARASLAGLDLGEGGKQG